jgi:hydroxyethylthiazole kinase-like uncharacterized protein yjeF
MMTITENEPANWSEILPVPRVDGHKYDRGHALIFGAPLLTGATRLAASACSRMGAGLVTVHAGEKADIYRCTLPADIMVTEADPANLRKVTGVLAGPGGIDPDQQRVIFANPWNGVRVFDADCLPRQDDFQLIDQRCILTPHAGEFCRMFPDLADNLKVSREACAAEAAKRCGAIIVLKGQQSIIAEPSGAIVVNRHASPYLAKAGTGDVLAGMITGLVTQGMASFEAACAAVWMHGDAGRRIGAGLVAGDIEGVLPALLKDLLKTRAD